MDDKISIEQQIADKCKEVSKHLIKMIDVGELGEDSEKYFTKLGELSSLMEKEHSTDIVRTLISKDEFVCVYEPEMINIKKINDGETHLAIDKRTDTYGLYDKYY